MFGRNRPRLACEVSVDGVVAARAGQHGDALEAYVVHRLPEGSLAPDLAEANVLRPETVRQVVSDVMTGVAARSRDVIAVLPDAAVRVVLLDFEALQDKRPEAEAVVRFRLKKSLPFDVERARVSYHVQPASTGIKVIAAVALASVVEEYESAFRSAGYNPGVVLPSMLAALGAVDAHRPTMVVKVDVFTTSIAILDRSQLLLFRTLENTHGAHISGEQLAEDVYPSVVFFQDTYQLDVERIFVAGMGSEPALRGLHAQTGVEVEELVSESHIGAGNGVERSRLAGVVGALVW
jgi:type IV pilus assembly protein PilM